MLQENRALHQLIDNTNFIINAPIPSIPRKQKFDQKREYNGFRKVEMRRNVYEKYIIAMVSSCCFWVRDVFSLEPC